MGVFALETSGPANASGQTPQATPGGLVLDQQNNIVSSVGSAGTENLLTTTLAIFQEQTALTSITTAQNLLSQALNSYVLNRANRTLRIRGAGIYTSPGTTTPTITITVKLGTTTLCTITTGAVSATATTNGQFQFEFTASVKATGSSAASIESHGFVKINLAANTLGAAINEYLDQNTAVIGSLNLQQALTLAVTIAASGAGISGAQLLFGSICLEGA